MGIRILTTRALVDTTILKGQRQGLSWTTYRKIQRTGAVVRRVPERGVLNDERTLQVVDACMPRWLGEIRQAAEARPNATCTPGQTSS